MLKHLTLFMLSLSLLAIRPVAPRGAESPTATVNYESKFLRNIKVLTQDGYNGEAYFSADGKAITFQSIRADHPYYQIYYINPDGSGQRMISTGKGKTTCAWFHPNGKKFIYASTHHDPQTHAPPPPEATRQRRYEWDFNPAFDIFEADLNGNILRRLTDTPGYDAECAYSPDGKLIVFTSQRDAPVIDPKKPELDIYVMDANGKNVRRLTHEPGYDGGAFFSPDGKWIIYRHISDDYEKGTVYLLSLDGKTRKQLTHDDDFNWAPFFHPDGKRFVWVKKIPSSDNPQIPNFEIYLGSVDGSFAPLRLTYHEYFDGFPAFSPDGKKLIWSRSFGRGQPPQIVLADFIDPHRTIEQVKRSADITADEIQAHINYLASDALEGRQPGTVGIDKAASYIAEEFKRYGLEPIRTSANGQPPVMLPSGNAGVSVYGNPRKPSADELLASTFRNERGSYLQTFEVVKGVQMGSGNTLQVNGKVCHPRKDFQPFAFSTNGKVENAPVVFVGYGLQSKEAQYDDYAGVDVKGKVVLLMRYSPEGNNPHGKFGAGIGLRDKARTARNAGAAAMLLVNPPDSGEDRLEFAGGNDASDAGIPCFHIKRDVADAILRADGKTLEELHKRIKADLRPQSFEVKGATVSLQSDVVKERKPTANVVGILPGSDPQLRGEFIVIGAHYDHLGRFDVSAPDRVDFLRGASLAPQSQEPHRGADDNASGTAGLLEIAQHLAAQRKQLKRSVLFVAFSAEEMGLLGSKHFVENPPVPLRNIVAMLNMDMIGRMREDKLSVLGVGTSPAWRDILHAANEGLNLILQFNDQGPGPSDQTSFYNKDIPVLHFYTGAHPDYHKPSDEAYKINAEGEARVLTLVTRVTLKLADASPRLAFTKTTAPQPQATSFRVTLRIIPDYGFNGEGMRIDALSDPNGPAGKAGIKAGDIIISFGGKPVRNVQDYTAYLGEHQPGDEVEVVLLRGREKVTVKVKL
ncbi:MAG: M20/M25/M40 family metallo-hydrolase [Abditibacteriales bacterium]|nr:M20/M25/M40 family metallo-hydrolase [Abditibacteriales bacterium]MDW8364532.1 M20/M25/M40 family metallo-hydrolase [Abditibacteriales bacterium]